MKKAVYLTDQDNVLKEIVEKRKNLNLEVEQFEKKVNEINKGYWIELEERLKALNVLPPEYNNHWDIHYEHGVIFITPPNEEKKEIPSGLKNVLGKIFNQ